MININNKKMLITRSIAFNIRRLSTFKTNKCSIAFAFDIDGVLLQSKTPIPKAAETLNLLQRLNVPYCLLTNGGGMTEQRRSDFLNSVLKSDSKNPLVTEDQLIQSHTPLRKLSNKYNRILLIGGPEPEAREVGYSYGFKQIIRSIDLIKAAPNIWPFQRFTDYELQNYALDPSISSVGVGLSKDSAPVEAVVVLNDPRDMGTELQVLLDILNSKGGHFGTARNEFGAKPSVPIIWSNSDFLWSTGFKLPRFGQGAFRLSVRELYQRMNNGCELEDEIWGKPYKISYEYAQTVLTEQWLKLNNKKDTVPEFENVYMVGDNPESDIKGGNNFGWNTILLRSGVYKDGDFEINPQLAKPTFGIHDNVWEGVTSALRKHNLI